MVEKYDSAALRHYEDAELLRANGCLDNAGHLIGFAAECAIKHGISTFNPNTNSPHGHLPEFLTIALKHLNGRGRNSKALVLDVERSAVFSGWDVGHRYCETGTILTAELDAWFKAASRLIGWAGIKVRK
jgi:hypothetical protein